MPKKDLLASMCCKCVEGSCRPLDFSGNVQPGKVNESAARVVQGCPVPSWCPWASREIFLLYGRFPNFSTKNTPKFDAETAQTLVFRVISPSTAIFNFHNGQPSQLFYPQSVRRVYAFSEVETLLKIPELIWRTVIMAHHRGVEVLLARLDIGLRNRRRAARPLLFFRTGRTAVVTDPRANVENGRSQNEINMRRISDRVKVKGRYECSRTARFKVKNKESRSVSSMGSPRLEGTGKMGILEVLHKGRRPDCLDQVLQSRIR